VQLWRTSGLLLLNAHVSAVGELIKSYSVSCHQFAVDTAPRQQGQHQRHAAMDRHAHCSVTVRLWFLQNGLQLNADKSEVVFIDTPAQLRSASDITTIDVAGSTLPVASQLKLIPTCSLTVTQFDCHTV